MYLIMIFFLVWSSIVLEKTPLCMIVSMYPKAMKQLPGSWLVALSIFFCFCDNTWNSINCFHVFLKEWRSYFEMPWKVNYGQFILKLKIIYGNEELWAAVNAAQH